MFLKRSEVSKSNRIDSHEQLLSYSRRLLENAQNGQFWSGSDADVQGNNEILENIRQAVQLMQSQAEVAQMRLTMLNQALHAGIWESEIVAGDPLDHNNIVSFSKEFREMLGYSNSKEFPMSSRAGLNPYIQRTEHGLCRILQNT